VVRAAPGPSLCKPAGRGAYTLRYTPLHAILWRLLYRRDARPRRPADAARPRRRGDRM